MTYVGYERTTWTRTSCSMATFQRRNYFTFVNYILCITVSQDVGLVQLVEKHEVK